MSETPECRRFAHRSAFDDISDERDARMPAFGSSQRELTGGAPVRRARRVRARSRRPSRPAALRPAPDRSLRDDRWQGRAGRRGDPRRTRSTSSTADARGITRPALADPDQLATGEQDLAGAEAVETDEPRPRRRAHRRVVHDEVVDAGRSSDRLGETVAQPHHRPVDVVGPTRHRCRNDHVEPCHLTGHQQHRSPTASPAHDIDPRVSAGLDVDVGLILGRAEHQRWRGDVVSPDLAARWNGHGPGMEVRCRRA